MINVRISDAGPSEHLLVELDGHSSADLGDAEKFQVCAAVSAMAVSLSSYLGQLEYEEDEDIDGLGKLSFVVPPSYYLLLNFFLHAVHKIGQSYPGHITVTREDFLWRSLT